MKVCKNCGFGKEIHYRVFGKKDKHIYYCPKEWQNIEENLTFVEETPDGS